MAQPKRIRVEGRLLPRCPNCQKEARAPLAEICAVCEVAARTYAGVEFSVDEWKQIENYAEAIKKNEPHFTLAGYQTLAETGRAEHRQECHTIASWTNELGNAPFNDNRFRNGMNGNGPEVVVRIARRIAARRKAFELADVSVYQWPTEEEKEEWSQRTCRA